MKNTNTNYFRENRLVMRKGGPSKKADPMDSGDPLDMIGFGEHKEGGSKLTPKQEAKKRYNIAKRKGDEATKKYVEKEAKKEAKRSANKVMDMTENIDKAAKRLRAVELKARASGDKNAKRVLTRSAKMLTDLAEAYGLGKFKPSYMASSVIHSVKLKMFEKKLGIDDPTSHGNLYPVIEQQMLLLATPLSGPTLSQRQELTALKPRNKRGHFQNALDVANMFGRVSDYVGRMEKEVKEYA